jgi:trk system potassium uptake protein TrkH
MLKHFQLIGFTVGVLLLILGTAMLLPALVDWRDDHANAHIFLESALIAWFFGGALFFSHHGTREPMTLRQAFMMTTLSWVATSLICAMPLWLSDLDISFTDAFFESVSGVTTTGSTVLSGLDKMSRGVLLWRSITQGIGGIGIVAFVIILLPLLKVGGMQLFHTESSDISDKALPRTGAVMKSLLLAYAMLTGFCALSYYIFGMNGFDAINHALTTLSTGGYSTHDASFGAFSPLLQNICTFFMFLGGLPFVLYVRMMTNNQFGFHKDPQVRAFAAIVAALSLVMTLDMATRSHMNPGEALHHALFNIVSALTTTGYATTDYLQWGPFCATLFFFITYLGACAGSTSGGIKMVRIIIATKALGAQFKRLIFPHGTFLITYEGRAVEIRVVYGVLGFLFVYVAANVMLTIALSLTGLDFATAVSGAATAIANVGPGIGTIIGPAGNFESASAAAKWMLCAGMIIGRLEIMTVLVLFTPSFWKH